MQRVIHVLTLLLVIELAGAALGHFSPERWAGFGMLALVLMIPTTALLGIVQLLQTRRG